MPETSRTRATEASAPPSSATATVLAGIRPTCCGFRGKAGVISGELVCCWCGRGTTSEVGRACTQLCAARVKADLRAAERPSQGSRPEPEFKANRKLGAVVLPPPAASLTGTQNAGSALCQFGLPALRSPHGKPRGRDLSCLPILSRRHPAQVIHNSYIRSFKVPAALEGVGAAGIRGAWSGEWAVSKRTLETR